MATQRENVQINLKISGIEDFKQLKDLNKEIIAQKKAVTGMDKNDPGYEQAKVRLRELISLQREWRQDIYGTRDATKELATECNKIKDIAAGVTLGSLLSDGIQSALDVVTQFVSGSEEAYKEAEQNQAQLSAALLSTEGAAGRTKDQLNDLAGELMNLTGVDDDLITKSEALLLTFTSISGEVYDAALPAILDLSKALGSDLEAATVQVGKALNNPIQGLTALRKVGISFSEDQKNVIKRLQETGDIAGAQKIILAELTKEFGGVAEAVANTESGSLERFQTRMGNIQESIGAFLTKMKATTVQTFNPFIVAIEKMLSINLSEKFEKDRFELVKLELQIKSTNTSQENRIKLINQLKDQYPEYFKNINAELGYTEDLVKAFKTLNNEYLNRIILQKQNEKFEEQEEERAKVVENMLNTEVAIREKLARLHEKFPEMKLVGKTDFDQLKNMNDQYLQMMNNQKRVVGGVFDPFFGVGRMLSNYTDQTKNLESQNKRSEKLLEARNDIAKRLGINTDKSLELKSDGKPGVPTIVPPVIDKKAKADAERLKNEAIAEDKKLTEAFKSIGAERLNNLLSDNEKEVELVKQKYQKLIEEEKAFLILKGATAEQKKSREDQIAILGTQRDQAVADTRIKIEKEMSSAISNLRTSLVDKQATELEKEKDQINKFYDDLEKKNAGNAEILARINQDRATDLTDAELREKQRLIDEKEKLELLADSDLTNTHAGRLAKIKQQYDAEIDALKEKLSAEGQLTQEYFDLVDKINLNRSTAIGKEEATERKQKLEYGIQAAEMLGNAVSTIEANNRRNESDQKLKQLDDQRNNELAKKNLTEEQKKAINDKYDAKVRQEKLRAWLADQNAAARGAIIGGLLGAAKALPNLFLAGLALASGAASAIAIKKEKPPVFSKGGMIPQGPSHAEGGINLVDNNTGRTIGEMEGGEPVMILSKETARNNAGLINELLFNSQFRNGARVSVNAELASHAIRPFKNGGMLFEESGGINSASGNVPGFDLKSLENKLDEKFDQLINKFDEGLKFNYRNDVEYRDKISKIQSRVNA